MLRMISEGIVPEAAADVQLADTAGSTPLMAACQGARSSTLMSRLLRARADPNARMQGGFTALLDEYGIGGCGGVIRAGKVVKQTPNRPQRGARAGFRWEREPCDCPAMCSPHDHGIYWIEVLAEE